MEKLDFKNIPVLILVGGKGTRLASIVSEVPKPMAPIDQRPFLEFIVELLKNAGFTKLIFLTGYKHEVIHGYFGDGNRWGVDIVYSREELPLGTGGAIKQAVLNYPAEKYLVLNGDTFYNVNMCQFISKSDAEVNLALHQVASVSRYGAVVSDSKGFIKSFIEKNLCEEPGFINGGVYFIDRNVVSIIADGFVSFETDIFPDLIKSGNIKGFPMEGEFIDIGIPEDYYRAKSVVPRWLKG